jgi:hypothetical protein
MLGKTLLTIAAGAAARSRPSTDPVLVSAGALSPMPHTSRRSGGGWEVTLDAATIRF